MIGSLGLTASIVGAGSALIGTYAAIRAARGQWSVAAAIRAAWCALAGLAAANGLMVVALVRHDFSIAYVAQVGSRETPLLFTVASLWGALEGSILFWAGLLAAVTVLLALRTRDEDDRGRLPWALAVLLALTAFFALIVVGPGNPWGRVWPVPADGPGPNPLLQDHPLMAFHPPLLYLGFVGLAVPFALTVDALLGGRLDEGWLRLSRRWTLGPWVLLTLGLVAGAWWSYAVLGWGGYWAWDPVENVALLPWLTATAFLHSAMVGRRGGLLLPWNVALVVASFALTLFATLVTRSGVLDSVHAFTRSAIGYLFVGLLGAVLVGTVGLALLRLPGAGADGRLAARGRAFLLNNLLLAATATTVLFGTIFPLVAEAVAEARLSVGAPYFDRVVGPLAVGLLVLVGTGPALPWGDWSPRARRALVPGAGAAAVTAAILASRGADPAALAGTAAGTFALVQSGSFLVRRVLRRSGPAVTSVRIRRLNARMLGGLVSHVGVGLLALAVVASGTGKREVVRSLRPGDTVEAFGRSLTFVRSEERPGPNRTVVAATLRIGEGASGIEVEPALNVVRTSSQAIASPAILPGPGEDLYIVLLDLDPTTGAATVRIGSHPFVSWIWPAGALVAFGGALAAWPVRARGLVPAPAQEARQQNAADPQEPLLDGITRYGITR